ncbi:hypothetical protein GOP47_0003100 [Adiantum capillus-veneris]|uniref:Pectin acetylesterase n=1 Tax=Adiantum capillus-veneris TaxID=13818 RepID=A0A9D4VBV2_ADICA|nr:hypothetical protein GOP47_0003100 [Adiantum capillus-veneris]
MSSMADQHQQHSTSVSIACIFITAVFVLTSVRAQNLVGLTLLSPVSTLIHPGAVCLDGSLPGYHLEKGHGTGKHSWLVHLEGGGWCSTVKECMSRAKTARGSSSFMGPIPFDGHLSNSSLHNPGFYNWNRVMVRYCDGASFSGNVEEPAFRTSFPQIRTKPLFFRGQRVWDAVVEELLTQQGMRHATQVILSGDSAGGLAAFHHCNDLNNKMPHINATLKCLLDGALFLDIPTISGVKVIRNLFQSVTTLHNVTILPRTCTSYQNLGKCFFPQYNLHTINVPMFFLQSSYDSWQTALEAFTKWYFEEQAIQNIDCKFPCNKTCK